MVRAGLEQGRGTRAQVRGIGLKLPAFMGSLKLEEMLVVSFLLYKLRQENIYPGGRVL